MSRHLSPPIDASTLLELLPHRYPFLLVDRILEMERGVRIVGLKNVTLDEPYLTGRPGAGDQVMPNLLVVEALAQTGAALLMASQDSVSQRGGVEQLVYFASANDVVFGRLVRPGDALRLEITVTQARGRLRKVHGIALVDGESACEGTLAAVLVDRLAQASATDSR